MKTKKCNGLLCNNTEQDITLFSIDKRSKDGLQSTCKLCYAHYRKINAKEIKAQRKIYRQENAEKIKLSKKEYAIKNSNKIKIYKKSYYETNKEILYKKSKEYASDNKEHISEYMKEYREEHKDIMSQQKKEWAVNNPEKVKANGRKSARRRRAKKLEIRENFTSAQEQVILKAFDNKCYNCGETNKLHIDHHRPLSKGNALTLQNAVVLCNTCNSSKGSKDPEDFYGTKKCKQLDKKLKKLAQSHS